MKKYLLSIVIFLTSSFSVPVLSGTPPFQGCIELGCIGKIDKIYLHPSGMVKVPPPIGADTSKLKCTLSEGVFITLKREHVHFKEMYSILLSAHASGKEVYLRVIVDSPDCEIHYSVIY
ncbi:hypothetical protein [Aliikangiella maris]|uniref:DUF4431 domain-containing protein n=2 Tax=Aliikangiella maris TaxID=3162458 RepID=A0ABV3MVJ4_9GAMM